MGLDVYVGSLTRYYVRDWKTSVELAAEELGVPYHVVRSESPPADALTDPAEIRETVLAWREVLAPRVSGPDARWEWRETGTEPWFSERPAWDGWGALMLLAAYDERPDLDRPEAVAGDWAQRDPAWRSVTGAGGRFGRLLRGQHPAPPRYASLYNMELWVPADVPVPVLTEDPGGNPVGLASTDALLRDLRAVNERTLRLTEVDVDHHRQNAEDVDAPFEAKARWGLSVFLWCAERAVEHQLPMRLDY